MTLSEVSSTKYTLMGQSAFSGGHGMYHWPAWAEGLQRQPSPGLMPVGDSGLRPRSGPAAPLSYPHRARPHGWIPGQLFLSELPGAMISCCWAWTAPRSTQSRRAEQGLRSIFVAPMRPNVLQQGEATPVVSASAPPGPQSPLPRWWGSQHVGSGRRPLPSSLRGCRDGKLWVGFSRCGPSPPCGGRGVLSRQVHSQKLKCRWWALVTAAHCVGAQLAVTGGYQGRGGWPRLGQGGPWHSMPAIHMTPC